MFFSLRKTKGSSQTDRKEVSVHRGTKMLQAGILLSIISFLFSALSFIADWGRLPFVTIPLGVLAIIYIVTAV